MPKRLMSCRHSKGESLKKAYVPTIPYGLHSAWGRWLSHLSSQSVSALFFLCRLCPALLDVLWTFLLVASTLNICSEFTFQMISICVGVFLLCFVLFFRNAGVRLNLAVCRREGKISTISNNNSYLQAQGPQQVSLSIPVTQLSQIRIPQPFCTRNPAQQF